MPYLELWPCVHFESESLKRISFCFFRASYSQNTTRKWLLFPAPSFYSKWAGMSKIWPTLTLKTSSKIWSRWHAKFGHPWWLIQMPIWLVSKRLCVQSPPGPATFFWLIVKYFLRSFSPFCWLKKGICQFLPKECAQVLLTGLNVPRKKYG